MNRLGAAKRAARTARRSASRSPAAKRKSQASNLTGIGFGSGLTAQGDAEATTGEASRASDRNTPGLASPFDNRHHVVNGVAGKALVETPCRDRARGRAVPRRERLATPSSAFGKRARAR